MLEGNKTAEMFQAMIIVSMKMNNLGLKVWSLKTKLIIVERKKQGLLKQMKEHEEFRRKKNGNKGKNEWKNPGINHRK